MFFQHLQEAPPDPIFGLLGAFNADLRKEKINLMVGIYKDDAGHAPLLKSVEKAQGRVHEKIADYLPIDGLHEMVEALTPLVFGERGAERIYGAHTAGGTGALRVGAELLGEEGVRLCYLPNQTWPNHPSIFEMAGCKVEPYPYYNQAKRRFDFEAMIAFLQKAAERSVVLLHACCHNPTGCDPTREEWREISKVMKKRKLFPFFDFAYQGLGEGIEKDRQAIEMFYKDGHEMAIAYSCSKNFSMYCQRVGTLFFVSEKRRAVESQVKRIIRALYSNPPAHGARVVVEVLKQERELWFRDLEGMRRRLQTMREALVEGLGRHMDVDYLRGHNGMFSFVDLTKTQVEMLREQFAIYLTDNGRISVAGLTTKNVDYVVNSLVAVCAKR